MTNVQSPPGLLNIFGFLEEIGILPINLHVYPEEPEEMDKNNTDHVLKDHFKIYTIFDLPDSWVLDHFHQANKYPAQIPFVNIKLTIHKDKGGQSLEKSQTVREYLDAQSILDDNHIFHTIHRCQGLLSGAYLKSYVLYNYVYHELPAEYWCYDENWYRLLIDGFAQGNTPSIGEFVGNVYVKEAEAHISSFIDLRKRPLTIFQQSFFINLSAYSTPWLQTLAAIYDAYGKDELARVAKSSILAFITEYIKKHNLDIASTDIPFLAKFIRLAEQKEGKKYHAKRKLQKVNAQ